MATERLVALERAGTLKLYAINGGGAREVGYLEIGALADDAAVMVAAAFADLRAAVNNGQHEPAGARHIIATEQAKPPVLPRARTGQSAEGLHDLIVAYLREHGPMSTPEIAEGLRVEATGRSSPTKRVSNALYHMTTNGRVGKLGRGRWAAL